MAVFLVTEPTLDIYGITSIVNSLTQLRFVFSVDILEGNDSVGLEILDAGGVTNLLGDDQVLSYVVPTGGSQEVVVDLNQVMLHIMKNFNDDYIRFIVKYVHISSVGVTEAKLTSQIIAIFSNLPIHLDNGSNMANYLFKDRGIPPYTIPAARPLTDFFSTESNIVWRGFLKTISFVADSEIIARIGANDLESKIVLLDGSGNVLTSLTPQPILANDEVFEIFINTSLGPLTLADSFPTAKWMAMEVNSATLPGMPMMLSPYFFTIKSPCKPALMLGWLNAHGAPERWVFERDFIIAEEADRGITYEIPLIDDAATQPDLIGRVSDERFKEVLTLVADNVTSEQFKVLKGIKKSRLVWIALNEDDTNQIQVVVERDFKSQKQVRNTLTSFTVQVRLPTNVQLEEILDYADVG